MSWANSVAVTIDHTKVPSTQTGFPLPFYGTYPALATVANGGSVTNSSGFDIIFASDSAGASPLNFERTVYVSTTGTVLFWINIPSLSSSSDTVIYLLYGNSAVTTDQANPTSVWDSNFKAVYHTIKNVATSFADSTSNAANMTGVGSPTYAAAGAAFNGSSQAAYVAAPPMTVVDNFTMSCWVYPTSASSEEVAFGNGWGNITTGGTGYKLETSSGNWAVLYDSVIRFGTGTPVVLNKWSHIALVRSSGVSQFYLNGVATGSTFSNTPITPATLASFGAAGINTTPTFNGFWPGNIFEARMSATPRSANWLNLEYSAQTRLLYSVGITNTAFPVSLWSPSVEASRIAPPFGGGLAGVNHQIVKAPALLVFTPSHFNPVPVASALAGGVNGTAYSETITAQGGTSPYTFAVVSGALPTGTTLSSAGVITGTPSVTGTFTFTVAVTDASGFTGSQNFAIVIAAAGGTGKPIPYDATLPPGVIGVSYSGLFQTLLGTPSYAYALLSGSLPTGLSLNSTGGLTGTPTASGSFNFAIKSTDSLSATGGNNFSMSVAMQTLWLIATDLHDAEIGIAYSKTLTVSGGSGTNTFALTSGSLPTGLTLSSGGVISGTPAAGTAGSYSFTITVTDSLGDHSSSTFALLVSSITIIPVAPQLHDATLGNPYLEQMYASAGLAPFGFSIPSGALPAGLSKNSSGLIHGTPTATGSSAFEVEVVDANSTSGSYWFDIAVSGSIIVAYPPDLQTGTLDDFYSETLMAQGGVPPYSFVLSAGSMLPSGLVLASDGTISGTPSLVEALSFVVQVTDSVGDVGSSALRLEIDGPLLPTIVPTVTLLPYGVEGVAYSETITAQGGTPPYSYGINSGALPDGLTLGTDGPGIIDGTPTKSGTFNFQIIVFDADTFSGLQDFTIIIADEAAEQIVPYAVNLQTAFLGSVYSEYISVTGGTSPYSFVASGTLPTGMTLDESTGQIHGEPVFAGSFSFTITATDSLGDVGTTGFTIIVNTAPGTTTVTPVGSVLHDAVIGASYSESLSAAGGTSPYSFTITAGSLPTGMSMNGEGVISGTPTAVGTFTFTVQVRDTHGVTGSLGFSITVNAAAEGGNSGYAG
jgi:hypothetical protein